MGGKLESTHGAASSPRCIDLAPVSERIRSFVRWRRASVPRGQATISSPATRSSASSVCYMKEMIRYSACYSHRRSIAEVTSSATRVRVGASVEPSSGLARTHPSAKLCVLERRCTSAQRTLARDWLCRFTILNSAGQLHPSTNIQTCVRDHARPRLTPPRAVTRRNIAAMASIRYRVHVSQMSSHEQASAGRVPPRQPRSASSKGDTRSCATDTG